ncbi:Cof-type HAD-IIB family hydrolase [Paenibacillus protaetiae]|nr:Cof-type HAD-IIB family hydrolase [Paenibacillus protaetiae]
MVQLVALDMDGTLLNRDKRITATVRESLQRFMHQGGLLTIASGRFPASVWLHAKALGMNAPLIALNGAVTLDAATGKQLDGTAMPPADAAMLVRHAERRGAYIHLYGCNVLYVNEINEMNSRWPLANVVVEAGKPLTEDNYKEQSRLIQVQAADDLAALALSGDSPVYKATVISEDEALINDLVREYTGWGIFTITRTGRRRFDLNACGVSKRSALEQVSRSCAIPQAQVAAIGDYDNDIEMLAWAGLGIAMGNASDRVKQAANVVTTSNEEDGVAYAFSRYLI